MVRTHSKAKNNSGFSLMELLVTVAIIGVLSTAGVPMYRRMVGKAKKAEAKVNLGAIADLEGIFFHEYNAYGNNLQAMGFSIDGNSAQMSYVIGFPTGGCADSAIAAAVPGAATIAGGQIAAGIPTYYTANTATVLNQRSLYGASTAATAGNLVPTPAYNVCNAAVIPNGTFGAYTAVAYGSIRPPAAAAIVLGDLDQWTITQARTLTNTVDGS